MGKKAEEAQRIKVEREEKLRQQLLERAAEMKRRKEELHQKELERQQKLKEIQENQQRQLQQSQLQQSALKKQVAGVSRVRTLGKQPVRPVLQPGLQSGASPLATAPAQQKGGAPARAVPQASSPSPQQLAQAAL